MTDVSAFVCTVQASSDGTVVVARLPIAIELQTVGTYVNCSSEVCWHVHYPSYVRNGVDIKQSFGYHRIVTYFCLWIRYLASFLICSQD
jgi:hypothetical protein